MNKTILVLYTTTSPEQREPFEDKKYQQAYEVFYTLGAQRGLRLCRAPLQWYDTKLDRFRKAWIFTNKQWQFVTDVRPDLIYDRTSPQLTSHSLRTLLVHRYPFLNHPAFTDLASNKYTIGRLLSKFSLPTLRIETKTHLSDALNSLSGNWVVAKPEIGSGGHGVVITTKQEILRSSPSPPFLLQPFIDSSHGIPGITHQAHDLRLVFIDTKLIYSYVRIPKVGSLLANIAQGGNMFIVPKEKLPSSLEPALSAIHQAFAQFYSKIFTADFIFDTSGTPWLLEVNTMPGMYFAPGQEKERAFFYQSLLDLFAEQIK